MTDCPTERSGPLLELAKALCKFQGAIQSVPKRSVNPFFKSTYADLDAVWDMCRKPLSDNGLSVVQMTVESGDRLYLETLLLHISGEYIKARLPLYPKALDPQSVGSAITYARRYAMSAMLGVSADEDDDAEKATGERKPAAARPKPSAAPPAAPQPTASQVTAPTSLTEAQLRANLAAENMPWARFEIEVLDGKSWATFMKVKGASPAVAWARFEGWKKAHPEWVADIKHPEEETP